MTTETALPVAPQGVEASGQPNQADPLALANGTPDDQTPADGEKQPEVKPEKTAEQREIDRLRRGIDRKTRQLAEARAQAGQHSPVQQPARGGTTPATQAADEPVTLSRAELDAMVNERAAKIAPTIKQQQAEIEHRQGIVNGLAKEWGQEKFDAHASELDEAFGGLADASGKPKPATDAIFESEMPKALIEYLTDPDNADEAEALGRMSATQAGRTIAKIETKLSTKAAEAKPQRSNAATPIESTRGGGALNTAPDAGDSKFMDWKLKQLQGRTF